MGEELRLMVVQGEQFFNVNVPRIVFTRHELESSANLLIGSSLASLWPGVALR